MGEVYRAHDARLNRDVAIKILPDLFANDAERLARFQREAQVLGSLNHPHIAQIHGVEQGNALILELVDGPTLADVISKGPMPLDEALPVARQICEALAAAHEHGIVHRDLKPANIKLTADANVKVLDFGLAKALDRSDEPTAGSTKQDPAYVLSQSPTLTSPAMATHAGIILGTAAYMSPEQAKAKPVDKRTDVWAFGCVFYEMLTGARAFEGDDVSDTLAAILRGEPDWNRLPPHVPAGLAVLLKRCLEKDRRNRVADIAAARFVLNEPALINPPVAPAYVAAPRRLNRERVFWVALFILAATTATYLSLRQTSTPEPLRRLSVAIPERMGVVHLALSPDGRRLALAIGGEQGGQIWMRSLDTPDLQPLSGTFGARTPFWSPDNRSIGFFADGKLKVVRATGGPPQELCDGTGLGFGGSWNRDGIILFGTLVGNAGGIRRVNASGNGPCTDITNPVDARHGFPEFLPDGEHFLYVAAGADPATRGVYIASLADPAGRRLMSDYSSVMFSRSSSSRGGGHLLFLREGTLMAQPFDADTFQTTGDVVAVVTDASVSATPPQIAASVSADGLLVYLAGRSRVSQLTWIDRNGKVLGSEGAEGAQNGVALSPNEQYVLFGRDAKMWLRDLNRDIDTPFSDQFGTVVWSADGASVITSIRDGKVIGRHIATQKDEELGPAGSIKNMSDWSRDGRFAVFSEIHPKTQADIWVLGDPLNASNARKTAPYLVTPFQESQAQISPDGRWVAYASNESGGFAVYVSRFPIAGETRRISPGGGREPRWRRDGRELYYLSGTVGRYKMMAVPFENGAHELRLGAETALFDVRINNIVPQSNIFQYSPSADGQRFLVNAPTSDAEPTLNVISNWKAMARVASGKE